MRALAKVVLTVALCRLPPVAEIDAGVAELWLKLAV
jgi:hypothetical protein